jgi:hypothetical protein
VKILRGTLELAKAASRDSEVPLWLVGNKGVITDVVLSAWPAGKAVVRTYDLGRGDGDFSMMGITPGQFRYGKVITKKDTVLEDCLNLVEENGEWCFVDDFGDELPLEIVEEEERTGTAEEKK